MSHTLTPVPGYPIVPATVPDDGDDADAASVDGPLQTHDNGIATVAARVGGVAGTSEWSHKPGQTFSRITLISPQLIVPANVYVPPGGSAAAVALATRWGPDVLVAAGAGPGGRDLVTVTGKARTSLSFHTGVIEIGAQTPTAGDVLQSFSIRVTCGSANAAADDQMLIALVRRSSTGVQTTLGTVQGPATATTSTVNIAGLNETVGNGSTYALHVTSSAGADASHLDYVVAITMTWDQVVPTRRN
jgi:hypothetical protein